MNGRTMTLVVLTAILQSVPAAACGESSQAEDSRLEATSAAPSETRSELDEGAPSDASAPRARGPADPADELEPTQESPPEAPASPATQSRERQEAGAKQEAEAAMAEDYLKDAEIAEVVGRFKRSDPGMEEFFNGAYGFAVFPNIGKGGLIVGGAHGNGMVYERGKLIGKTSMTQVTLGAQVGGQAYSEVIFFQDKVALEDFKRGNFEPGAQVSAVAVTAGASADAAYSNGVAIFTHTRGGLMVEASVSGQQFDFEPL